MKITFYARNPGQYVQIFSNVVLFAEELADEIANRHLVPEGVSL